MKILVIGDGHSAIHEVSVAEAFAQLGHEVQTFYWYDYFCSRYHLTSLWLRAQNKFLIGPAIVRLNTDLLNQAAAFQPNLIFIYRGTHIYSRTLIELKRRLPDCQLFGYNNDDPFAPGHSPWLWRHFLQGIRDYHKVFAYRKHNIAEFVNAGAKQVEVLMPWFIPEMDKPSLNTDEVEKEYDVVFVGHYERDHRVEYLRRVAEGDWLFGLFGPDWDRAPSLPWLDRYRPVHALYGESYRQTLRSAKIALCFLSTLNRDTYTRRCFEIPALGVFMLCQYSDDLSNIFKADVDAVFFNNAEDMMQKIEYYLRHDTEREAIARSGWQRVNRDRHDVISRMASVCDYTGS